MKKLQILSFLGLVVLSTPFTANAFACECAPLIVQQGSQLNSAIQTVGQRLDLKLDEINNVTLPQTGQMINAKLSEVGNSVVQAIRGHIGSDQQLFHDLEVKLDLTMRNHAATTAMNSTNRTYAIGQETIGADGRVYRSGSIPSSTCAEVSARTTVRSASTASRANKWMGAGGIASADRHNRAAPSGPESMASAGNSMKTVQPTSEDPRENPLVLIATGDEAPKSVSPTSREKITELILTLTNPIPPPAINTGPSANSDAGKEYKVRSDLYNLKMLTNQMILTDTVARQYTPASPSAADVQNSTAAAKIWKKIDPSAKVTDEHGVMSELALLQTAAVHRYYDVPFEDPDASYKAQLNSLEEKGLLIELVKMQAISLRMQSRMMTLMQQQAALQAFNQVAELNGAERDKLQALYSRALARPQINQ